MLLKEQLKEQNGGDRFLIYYERYVEGILREQLGTGLRIGFALANWTNNTAESVNSILKMLTGILYLK